MSAKRANIEQEDSVVGQVFDARLLKRLISYMQPVKYYVVLAVALLFLTTAVELSSPLVIKYGVDHNLTTGELDGLGTVVFVLIGVLILGFWLRYLQMYLTQWIGQKVILSMRIKLFDHLQRLDLKFIDSRPLGWLMTRVTGDIGTLQEMLSTGLVQVFGDLFTLVGIMIVLLVLNWKLALVTFVVLPLIFWVVFAFRLKVRVTFRVIREALAQVNGFMQEHITGIRTVQLFVRENATLKRFHILNVNYRNAYIQAIRYYALFFPAITFLSSLAIALILLVGGNMINANVLTWGALVAFLQYSERFFRPIRDLSDKYNTMQAAMAAAERVFWLFDTESNISEIDLPKALKSSKGKIEFRSVSFEYNSGEQVLRNVSFNVEPGQTVAIVGATGAGKSTMLNLLLRFWDTKSGDITLDGVDIRNIGIKDLRRQFGLVQQDVFLFSGTIAENVTLGNPEYQGERLETALQQANAMSVITSASDGLNSTVGERGAKLSGGQKQLLAISRALITDPSILLLDEATATVDTETERRIQVGLERLMTGRTTLVVAHRLSTIRNADKIVVLHKGEIREVGKHSELIELNGIYARLHSLQFANGVTA